MIGEAPHPRHPLEVEDPTQPFSRAEIARLRRFAEVVPPGEAMQQGDPDTPGEAPVQTQLTLVPSDVPSDVPTSEAVNDGPAREADGRFELDGRWIRVSLEPFANFGMNGAPPGMIGAVDACFVSGAINALDGPEGVPPAPRPRLTEVYQTAEPEPEPEPDPPSGPPRKTRWLWAVAGMALLAMPVAVWAVAESRGGALQSDSSEAPAAQPPTVTIVAPVPEAPQSEFEVEVEDASEEDVVVTYSPGKSAQEKPHERKECVQRRKQAELARESGSWVELELLARVGKCWAKASEAKSLRMQALFQLERFEECVQLGAQSRAKEVTKWVSNCQRALD